MPGRAIMEDIYLLSHLLKKYRDKQIYIWCLYIQVNKDAHHGVETCVRICREDIDAFPIAKRLYQGSA